MTADISMSIENFYIAGINKLSVFSKPNKRGDIWS